MTDRTHPEALMQLADAYAEASFDQGLHKRTLDDAPENARSVLAAAVRSQHARIAELEAQLEAIGAGGVSGPLMGRVPLSANAGEPVAHLWQHCETGRTRIVMPDMIVDADASWQVVGPLYLGAAPPTAQAEGWTKPHRTITYTCPVCAASLERQE